MPHIAEATRSWTHAKGYIVADGAYHVECRHCNGLYGPGKSSVLPGYANHTYRVYQRTHHWFQVSIATAKIILRSDGRSDRGVKILWSRSSQKKLDKRSAKAHLEGLAIYDTNYFAATVLQIPADIWKSCALPGKEVDDPRAKRFNIQSRRRRQRRYSLRPVGYCLRAHAKLQIDTPERRPDRQVCACAYVNPDW